MINLIDALKNRNVVEFTYSGKKRKVEIYVIGVSASNSNEILIRAYERFKEFKLFKYNKMSKIKVLNQRFSYNRPDYNKDGDKAIVEVLFQV